MSNEKLKPCPFCGSNKLGISNKTATTDWKQGKRKVAIYCKKCNAYGTRILCNEQNYRNATEEAIQQAIDAWNKRGRVC